ncbi:MAG: hypothetical protein OHK0013_43050 [Sandaracinaceae bacterium]
MTVEAVTDADGAAGLCARHPDRPAAGRCKRCGDNLCRSCADERVDGVCRACVERLSSRGKVPQVEWLAVVTMVHGGLMLAYALLLVVYGVAFGAAFSSVVLQPTPGRETPPPELFGGIMAGTVGLMALGMLVPGLLQLVAGWYMRQFRYRLLAVVALVSGLVSILGCYCFPTSLALLVWGAIVLFDRDVGQRFEAVRGS